MPFYFLWEGIGRVTEFQVAVYETLDTSPPTV